MQQQINFLDTYCGKTSPEPTPQTMGMTSEPSSRRSAPSVTKDCMFLDLRTGSGNLLGSYWETDSVLRGEPWMHNTSESPSVAVESSLSDVLQMDAPEKYFLSRKACLGILRRAEKRGKQLPDMLKEALTETVNSVGSEETDDEYDYDDINDLDEDEEE